MCLVAAHIRRQSQIIGHAFMVLQQTFWKSFSFQHGLRCLKSLAAILFISLCAQEHLCGGPSSFRILTEKIVSQVESAVKHNEEQ